MSVTKNKQTIYHDTDQDVKYRAEWIRLDGLRNLQKLEVRGGMVGTVGNAPGEVDKKDMAIRLQDIKDNCSAAEKNTLRNAIAILERELARADEELTGEAHDSTDVFVEQ